MRVIDNVTQKEVKPGDTITSFRGEEWTLSGPMRPRIEGRSGKVLVTREEGEFTRRGEFYENVFGVTVLE